LSRAYATPLRLDIKPSPQRWWFYASLFLFVFASISLSNILFIFQFLMLVLSLIALRMDYLSRQPNISFVWQKYNQWKLIKNATEEDAELCVGSFNSAFLMILNFKCESGKRYSIVFLPHEVVGRNYRQLRVRFKVEGHKIFNKEKVVNH